MPVSPGHFDIHSLPCQCARHHTKYFEIAWFGYHLSFSLEFLYANGVQHDITHWLGSQSLQVRTPVIQNGTDIQRRIGQIFDQINHEYNDNSNLSPDIIAGLLAILLMYLRRQSPPIQNRATNDSRMVSNFLTSVKRQFTTKRLVYDYAFELSVTPNYLNRVIKKMTGTTASDHIRQQIVLEAKRQIIQSGASMKQVAYNLGFDNLAHFSKFFKNKSGQNYTTFKRSL